MSNLVHRRRRCARIDLHSILCLDGSTPEDRRFIPVYCLAIDARPKWGDGVTGRKYPNLLEGFPDGHSINGSPETSCINRKGLLMFLSYTQYLQANPFYLFNPW